MRKLNISIIVSLVLGTSAYLLFAENRSEDEFKFSVEGKTDAEYPDNPNIGYRSNLYDDDLFEKAHLIRKADMVFDLAINLNDNSSLTLNDVNVSEWIPTIPNHLREDEYLSHLALVNQEWNRNQVTFNESHFTSSNQNIVRVDIARNCLNTGLWEVILYTKVNNHELPISQGWFNFPQEEYERLFQVKNGLPFDKYGESLSNWKDPENLKINKSLLRQILKEIPITFEDLSNSSYPISGERQKKLKEIVYPEVFQTMKDLQTDQTTFATFSPPGVYDRSNPRKTELGRFYQLDNVIIHEVSNNDNKILFEIEFEFADASEKRKTHLILGGIDLEDIPTLNINEANQGWKNSMGFGNHTFYETVETHLKTKTAQNPYYGYLSNQKGEWLDSHFVGIDGPLMHFDKNDPNLLHVWLLSFERHALVGHYLVKLGS